MKKHFTLALLCLAGFVSVGAQASTFVDTGGFGQMLADSNIGGEMNGRTVAGHIDSPATRSSAVEDSFVDNGGFKQMLADANAGGEMNGRTVAGNIEGPETRSSSVAVATEEDSGDCK